MTSNSDYSFSLLNEVLKDIDSAIELKTLSIFEGCNITIETVRDIENPLIEAYLKIFYSCPLRSVVVIPLGDKKEEWKEQLKTIFFPDCSFLEIDENLLQVTKEGVPYSFILEEKESIVTLIEESKESSTLLKILGEYNESHSG